MPPSKADFSNVRINAGSTPSTTPLSVRGGGSAGAYTLVNSAIVYTDADGDEIGRIWFTDPDEANFNSLNLYIGPEAGLAQPTNNVDAGFFNLGLGGSALRAIDTGAGNIAIGVGALIALTSGNDNTVIGADNGALLDTSSGNVLIGSGVAASLEDSDENTIIGTRACELIAAGDRNVAIGTEAASHLSGATDSDINVIIGYQAAAGYGAGGTDLVLANQGVFIGAGCRPLANNTVNEIVIGYASVGHGDNTATLGSPSVTQAYLPLAIFQGTRAAAMGDWAAHAFSAGDYTSDSGTWTVASGDVTTNRYTQIGKTVFWQLVLVTTTVSGGQSQLRVAIPGSLTEASVTHSGTANVNENSANLTVGTWTTSGAGYVAFTVSGATWNGTTNTTAISAVVTFEIA